MTRNPTTHIGNGTTHATCDQGFTLIEVMVSMAVLTLILILTLSATDGVAKISRRTRARIDTFQEARAGYELMTRRLSQAMLNTYWDYFDSNGKTRDPDPTKAASFVAASYGRQSELHFVSGPMKTGSSPMPLVPDTNLQSATHGLFFVSPQGYSAPAGSAAVSANLLNLLNASGFFVEYSSDELDRPLFLQTGPGIPAKRWRFRLMGFNQPTETLQIYRWPSPTAGSLTPYSWFRDPLSKDALDTTLGKSASLRRVLAENVIALVLWPHRSSNDPVPPGALRQIAPDYLYDSRLNVTRPGDALASLTRNQLPPIVQVTMVAIDEASAARLQDQLSPATATTLPGDTLGLTGLFAKPSTSANPDPDKEGDQYRLDLQTLEAKLIALKLSYRVFSTDVSILQAKWSEN